MLTFEANLPGPLFPCAPFGPALATVVLIESPMTASSEAPAPHWAWTEAPYLMLGSGLARAGVRGARPVPRSAAPRGIVMSTPAHTRAGSDIGRTLRGPGTSSEKWRPARLHTAVPTLPGLRLAQRRKPLDSARIVDGGGLWRLNR